MPYQTKNNEYVIRGSCPYFICRCCRTKYGWEHQVWCDYAQLLDPKCPDCGYYNTRRKCCNHPARRKKGRDVLYERDQGPF